MVGRKEGKIYLSPHVLGRFVINKREAVDTFFGRKRPRTKEMQQGQDWHIKLGFTNEELFEKEMEVLGEKVVIRGVPDYIDENTVMELKTVATKYVSDRYLRGAEVQLLAYLWLTDRPNGKVVVVDRRTGDEIESFTVFRDDKRLRKVVADFIREIRKRERSSNLLVSLLNGPKRVSGDSGNVRKDEATA